jgi:hypothetical protein
MLPRGRRHAAGPASTQPSVSNNRTDGMGKLRRAEVLVLPRLMSPELEGGCAFLVESRVGHDRVAVAESDHRRVVAKNIIQAVVEIDTIS